MWHYLKAFIEVADNSQIATSFDVDFLRRNLKNFQKRILEFVFKIYFSEFSKVNKKTGSLAKDI